MPGKPYSEEELDDMEKRKAFSEHGMKSAGLSGAASGRQARGDAIDMMLQRRQKARHSMQGRAKRSGLAPTSKGVTGSGDDFDTEKAIRGGY